MNLHRILAAAALACAVLPSSALAQWHGSGDSVCVAPGPQAAPAALPDGAGGTFILWTDYRAGQADLYAQRLDADGIPLWAANGVPVCTAPLDQKNAVMAGDGLGGFVAAWEDQRNGAGVDIYAQRIGPTGSQLWTPDGVAVCTAVNDQLSPGVAGDGGGGAYVIWTDKRNSPNSIVLAQRLDATGAAQWTANGQAVSDDAGLTSTPPMVPDLAGGVLLCWNSAGTVLAQNIDAFGTRLWYQTGTLVGSNGSGRPALIASGAGRALVAWPGMYGVFGQSLLNGTRRWGNDGDTLSFTTAGQRGSLSLALDGQGGMIAAWAESHGGPGADFQLYAQRVAANGVRRWGPQGVLFSSAHGAGNPLVVPDGSSGAVLGWQDFRDGLALHVFAQRADSNGALLWVSGGVPVCTVPSAQDQAALVPAGAGGAVVAWRDIRGAAIDVYAGQLAPDGTVPVAMTLVSADASAAQVSLAWQAGPGLDLPFRLERRTPALEWSAIATVFADGTGRIAWVDRDVEAGERYGYRLAWDEGGAARTSPEAWVSVPARAELALEGARPNPGDGSGTVAFSLPDASPATLELVDVTGRRLWTREVGALGAGRHVVALAAEAPLAPGVYFVRLRAGARALVSRAAVVR